MRSPSKTRDSNNKTSLDSSAFAAGKPPNVKENQPNENLESTNETSSSTSSLTTSNNNNTSYNNSSNNNNNNLNLNLNQINMAVDSALRKYGWLYKLSQNGLKLWRKRYFVLTDYILDYYSGNCLNYTLPYIIFA